MGTLAALIPLFHTFLMRILPSPTPAFRNVSRLFPTAFCGPAPLILTPTTLWYTFVLALLRSRWGKTSYRSLHLQKEPNSVTGFLSQYLFKLYILVGKGRFTAVHLLSPTPVLLKNFCIISYHQKNCPPKGTSFQSQMTSCIGITIGILDGGEVALYFFSNTHIY